MLDIDRVMDFSNSSSRSRSRSSRSSRSPRNFATVLISLQNTDFRISSCIPWGFSAMRKRLAIISKS